MLIILADAELELLPEQIREDREAPGRIGKDTTLLDNHLFRDSIRRHFPEEVDRIGFPHISYSFVRMNEDSVLRDSIGLDYVIHTKHDIIIESADLRGIGPSYPEFSERVGRILVDNERRMSLLEYLDSRDIRGNTVVLHPQGNPALVVNEQLNFIIGGFPTGDFRSDLGNLRKFSIHEREITVPGALELLHFRLFRP